MYTFCAGITDSIADYYVTDYKDATTGTSLRPPYWTDYITAVPLPAVSSEKDWNTRNYVCNIAPRRSEDASVTGAETGAKSPSVRTDWTPAQQAFWAQTASSSTENRVIAISGSEERDLD